MALLLDSVEIPEEALAEKIFLLLAPRPYLRRTADELITWFAAKGDVFILDGSNSFDAYGVIRAIARHAKPELPLYLQRIHTARSFTCYQTLALCAQAKRIGYPVISLNISLNFNDENVLYEERSFLFQECLEALLELGQRVPLILLEAEASLKKDSAWVACFKGVAHCVLHLEQPLATQQPALF